jgi:hypothetical protein
MSVPFEVRDGAGNLIKTYNEGKVIKHVKAVAPPVESPETPKPPSMTKLGSTGEAPPKRTATRGKGK